MAIPEIVLLKISDDKVTVINEGGNLDETELFSLYVESETDIVNPILLVSDFPFKLELSDVNFGKFIYRFQSSNIEEYLSREGFKIKDYSRETVLPIAKKVWEFYRLFINYPIGECEIILIEESTNEILSKSLLNVSSKKIDIKEFSSLVNYLEEKTLKYSVWTKYSLLRNVANPKSLVSKSDWQLFFCENFLELFKNNYLHLFESNKISVLVPKHEIVEFSSDVPVGEDSLQWILNNLDNLSGTSSSDIDSLLVKNRRYRINEVLSNNLHESTNVVENQMIHGFIQELCRFLISEKGKLYVKIGAVNRQIFTELLEYYSFINKLKRIDKVLKILKNIQHAIDKYIPVSELRIDYSNSNKLVSKDHYMFVFQNLLAWLNGKDIKFSPTRKIYNGITRIDKLFERACFFKLLECFEQLGYTIEIDTLNSEIYSSKVTLSQKGKAHRLYFELMPTTLSTINRGGDLNPDFIIELEDGKYIILDAKYKAKHTVQKKDYPDLTLKYLHGIGRKDGLAFNPLALLCLIPGNSNNIDFYQRKGFDLFSEHPALPAIGCVEIGFEEHTNSLIDILKRLLNL